jgi:hypothetical protein
MKEKERKEVLRSRRVQRRIRRDFGGWGEGDSGTERKGNQKPNRSGDNLILEI